MAEPAPKCRHCNGWAFEPDVHPLAVCTACKGTGRPTPSAQQRELASG